MTLLLDLATATRIIGSDLELYGDESFEKDSREGDAHPYLPLGFSQSSRESSRDEFGDRKYFSRTHKRLRKLGERERKRDNESSA